MLPSFSRKIDSSQSRRVAFSSGLAWRAGGSSAYAAEALINDGTDRPRVRGLKRQWLKRLRRLFKGGYNTALRETPVSAWAMQWWEERRGRHGHLGGRRSES